MEANAMTLNDVKGILKRRKWSLILPFFIIFFAAAAVALLLPPIYKSTSTILIEEQEIPSDFVMTSVTSYAEQRLESINQRIMSTSKLIDIIKRFNLYQDLQTKWTSEEIVEKMREDVELETISADVVDRRTGRPTAATIAFMLSYEGKETPDTVQRVANELASLFLQENLQSRERHAQETTTFLEDEMGKVKADLTAVEAELSEFKEKHVNALPELLQVNLQNLNNIDRNIETLTQQLRSLKEREGYLQTQLASIPELERVNTDKRRLEELRMELVYLKTRFSDEYPDVIKVKAEIAELESQLGEKSKKGEKTPDNVAYITLASQLSSTQAEINSVKEQIKDLQRSRADYQSRIEATPRVEEAYTALMVVRDSTQAKYHDLMRKHMEAKMAYGLEKEQKGERFTLVDPARFPEKPYKPNRLAIMLIGLVLGIGAGAGMGYLREYTDLSVRSVETLVRATAFPVLASVPEIVTPKQAIKRNVKRAVLSIAVMLVIVGGLAAFHLLVMDLNIFWAKVMRRMAL